MKKEKHRAADANPALIPPQGNPNSTDGSDTFDYDKHIVDRVDESIWRAVYNGHFRLAVRCDRCGRWLTDGHSKRHRLGPRCKTRVAK